MARRAMSPSEIVAVLAQTPDRIAEITAALSAPQLHEVPAPGEWSANELLAHLRACSDVWGGAIATILGEDHPTIHAVNPRTYVLRTDYAERPFARSLDDFTDQRRALLAVVGPLEPERWDRTAIVTGAGAPLVQSAQGYAQRMAVHERAHWKQFRQIVDLVAVR